MIFWLLVVLLLLVSLAILLTPLMRRGATAEALVRDEQNINIAREQKVALDAQLSQAEISQSSYNSSYADIQGSLALALERDQSAAQSKSLSSGRWTLAFMALLIPVVSVSLYFKLGSYQVVQDPTLAQARAPQTAANKRHDSSLIAIKAQLRENPDSAENWYALGRVYGSNRQFEAAIRAYRKAHGLAGDQPKILFSLADAIAMQDNGKLLGEPEQLIARGLALSPRFPNGLWLAGLAAEQRQDFSAAHRHWTSLLPLIAINQQSSAELRRLINGLEQPESGLANGSIETASTAPAGVLIEVDISELLKTRVQPDQVVFVYAKALRGPPMPLAVKKIRVSDLPTSIRLSDADAMLPTMKLSAFPQIIIGARVSQSGDAVSQPGDFFAEIELTQSNDSSSPIALLINHLRE